MNMSSNSKVYAKLTWGGALSTKTAFFYCVSKIGLYSIALSFLCILKIKGVVDNG